MSVFQALADRVKRLFGHGSTQSQYQAIGEQTIMDEETPLLRAAPDFPDNLHNQFVTLMGIPSKGDGPYRINLNCPRPGATPLYERATRKHRRQSRIYILTASINNTLLLSQVVLGAALTALGASQSPHQWITVFGALNTVIAGVVAYMKSRGQPMRSRMFRDDLERVVEEIENSEIMWLGIARGAHGYDAIDTDDEVSVRSEVARLTKLFDRAVRNNTLNNPDMYQYANGHDATMNLRAKPPMPLPPLSAGAGAGPAVAAPKADDPAVSVPPAAPPAPADAPKPPTEDAKAIAPPAAAAPVPPKPDAVPDAAAKKDSAPASSAAPSAPTPAPVPAAPKVEPPSPATPAPPDEGTPLAADIDEGPVTNVKIRDPSPSKRRTSTPDAGAKDKPGDKGKGLAAT